MARTLQVRVVSPSEWARLRKCPHTTEDNMGFADPHKGTAYVRDTHLPTLNRYLVQHEFDHLLEERGTDECACGIRHKKFFKQVGLPILGGVLGTALAGPIGTALGASAGGLTGLGAGLAGAVGGGLGTAAGSALGGASGGQAVKSGLLGAGLSGVGSLASSVLGQGASPLSNVFKSVGAGASRAPLSAVGGVSQGAASSTPSALSSGILRAPLTAKAVGLTQPLYGAGGAGGAGGGGGGGGSFLANLFGGGGGGGTTAATGGGSTLGKIGNFVGSRGGSALTAAALLGIGGSRKTPQVPDVSGLESVQALKQQGGFSPLGQLAQSRLSEQLTAPFQGVPESVRADVQNTFNRRRQQVASQFKLFRPNADLATDTAFRQAMTDVDREEAATLGNLELQERERFNQLRRQDISTALGIDEQTLNTLASIAQLDVSEIQSQLELDAQSASEFKQTFGNLASIFAANAAGLNLFKLP